MLLMLATAATAPSGPTVARAVADRVSLPVVSFVTAGGRRSGTFRTRHKAYRSVASLRVMHSNLGPVSGGASAFTQALSIEKMDGTLIPATYDGAARVTVEPREHVTTDSIPVRLAAGEEFFIRTYREVEESGMSWSGTGQMGVTSAAYGEGSSHYSGGADVTAGVWESGWTADGIAAPLPHAILADVPEGAQAALLVGDSIMAVGQDIDAIRPGMGGGYGVRSAINAGLPYLHIAQGGKQMREVRDGDRIEDWMPPGLVETCTVGLIEMGRNDLTANSTTLHADAVAVWSHIAGRGIRLAQCTVTPYTDSTDAWATTGSQTIHDPAAEAKRLAYNAWLRDGAPIADGVPVSVGASGVRAGEEGHPLVKIFEATDQVETARDSGIWKPHYTIDGLHPSSSGHQAIAPVIDLTTLL